MKGFVVAALSIVMLNGCSGGGGNPAARTKAQTVPVKISTKISFTKLESSGNHVCGVANDGNTYCWGKNQFGELGVSDVLEICKESYPCTSTPQKVNTPLQFVSLVDALNDTYGLTAEGVVYSWGFGVGGQLGNGQQVNSSTPAAVSGGLQFEVVRTTPYGTGTCGIASDDELYCWGPLGILFGNGNNSEVQVVPIKIDFMQKFVAFDLGEQHACGVTASGQAYCWGNNWYGQLGVGSAGGADGLAKSAKPTPVTGGHVFRSIVAGSNQTCALTETGAAFCWGSGINTGSGAPSSYVPTPQPVSGNHSFVSLHAGPLHTCGLTATGEAYCWGENYMGVIGDGTQISRATPVKVKTDQKFASLSHRPYCGLTAIGDAYCWGDNSYGQVGLPP